MSKATTTLVADEAPSNASPSAFTGVTQLREGQDASDLSDALIIDAAGPDDADFVAGKIRKKGFVEPERRTTWYNAAFILVAELVGTGVLGLPYTFATVGWIPGVALLFVFAGLAFYSGCEVAWSCCYAVVAHFVSLYWTLRLHVASHPIRLHGAVSH